MDNMLHQTRIFVLGSFFLSAMLATPAAHAATRTVYFTANGTNRTIDGLSQTAQSTCKITITNPSSVAQDYSVTATPTSVDAWSGGSATASVAATSSCGAHGAACTGSLAANGGTVTLTYTFTTYPARSGSTAFPGRQQLRCAGSISGIDQAAGTPGYLIASGVLVTFVESARMNTDASTGGTSVFGGIAVYSQVPIAINRSKPF